MTIETVATEIISFITINVSAGFVQRAGERLYEKIEEIIKIVRKKFKGDNYAEQTLERTFEKPESQGRKAALQEVLLEKMEGDKDFVENLIRLIQDAKQADINHVLALGERSVVIGDDVNNSVIITGDRVILDNSRIQSNTATDNSTEN